MPTRGLAVTLHKLVRRISWIGTAGQADLSLHLPDLSTDASFSARTKTEMQSRISQASLHASNDANERLFMQLQR